MTEPPKGRIRLLFECAAIALATIAGFIVAGTEVSWLYLLWAQHSYPHDGQAGLGVMLFFPIAGLLGSAIGFAISKAYFRNRRVRKPTTQSPAAIAR
jgi:hypothetical protein